MIWETRDEYQWRTWYAWYPVYLHNAGGKRAWLETIACRYAGSGRWEYKALR